VLKLEYLNFFRISIINLERMKGLKRKLTQIMFAQLLLAFSGFLIDAKKVYIAKKVA
jgi:hypothetical protein